MTPPTSFLFFFFNDTATTEIYTLSLHDALPIYRLLAGGHLGRLGHVEVALVDQLLDDLVEQLPQLALEVGVAGRVAGRFAAQQLEHFGRQLARVHKRLEDRLAQGVERAVGFFLAELAPER